MRLVATPSEKTRHEQRCRNRQQPSGNGQLTQSETEGARQSGDKSDQERRNLPWAWGQLRGKRRSEGPRLESLGGDHRAF